MLGFNLPWIFAHLIGDYLLQNDWMAKNKKQSHLICLLHIVTYMIPFLFVDINWLQFSLISLQHYIQDRTMFVAWFCKITNKFQSGPGIFWGHIIVDNIFHILWIAAVIHFL